MSKDMGRLHNHTINVKTLSDSKETALFNGTPNQREGRT